MSDQTPRSPFTPSPPLAQQSTQQYNPSAISGAITVLQQIVLQLAKQTAAINSKFPDWVAVPATATSAGNAGQVAYDATHFYVCVAPSVWVRVALATF